MARRRFYLLGIFLLLCEFLTFASRKVGETIFFEDGTSGVVFYVSEDGKSGWVVDPVSIGSYQFSKRENSDTPIPNYGNALEALQDTAGYNNTKILRASGSAHEYPAAWAVDFEHGWYLPSLGQTYKLLASCAYITLSQPNGYYLDVLSSTEKSAGYCYAISGEFLRRVECGNSLSIFQVRNFNDEEFDETISYEWNTGATSRVIVEEAKKTFAYEVTATNNYGCQAKAEKTIVVNTSTPTVIKDTICEGYTYEKFGFSATRSGTYKKTLKGENGECDVTTTLQLVVMPNKKTNLTDKVCQGEYYNKNGFSIKATAAGVYKDTAYLNTAFGCDSTVTLALNVLPLTRDTVRDRICQTEEYGLHGFDLPAGLSCGLNYYSVETTGSNGCKHTTVLALTVDTTYQVGIMDSVGMGEPYKKYGFNLPSQTASDVHELSLKTASGCDSLVRLTLNVLGPLDTTIVDSICRGEEYLFGGKKLTEADTYVDELKSVTGRDSIVTLELVVLDTFHVSVYDTICNGEQYIFGGKTYKKSGKYVDELKTIYGCDSIVTLHLTVNDTFHVSVYDTICNGERYVFGGKTYKTSGKYVNELKTIHGCDSIVTLHLTVNDTFHVSVYDTICNGERYIFGGKTYKTSGKYVDELKTIHGCDSIVTLYLTVNDTFHVTVLDTICNGDTYRFGIHSYTEAGTYVDELKTVHGCDSIVTLHLTVNDTFHVSVYDTICNGDEYIFGGNPYTVAGSYVDELKTIHGCDSIVTLYLTVHDTFHITVLDTICDGDEYIFGGKPYTVAGTYVDELKTIHGCDSIVTLYLTVHDTFHVTVKDTICNGETYRFGIHSYTEAGTYVDELKTIHGCDSIVTLHLTVNDTFHVSVYDTICNGDEYIFGGKPYTKAGSYVDELKTIYGCDSIVTLYLTVHDTFHVTVRGTICDGEEYIFGGKPYTVAGTYVDELKTIHGCDSIVTLQLTVHDTFHVTVKDTICNGETYRFGAHSYTEAGTYVDELKTIHGCDSIVTLHLTVNDTFHVSVYDTICNGEQYIFGGNPYTVAGSYVDELKTIHGCDSIVTLHLTVHDTFHITVLDTICDGDEYIFGGKPYTVAGTYVDELKTIHGCDSIVTLQLTVHDTFHVTVKDTICNGETYRFGAHSYTEAGTYIDELKTIHGCDSIVTLHLTVHDTFHVSVYDTICNGDEYIFGGKTYTKAGSYVDELKTIYGCDSIVTLYLTVHDTFHITVHDTICDGEEYIFGGKPYTVAGTYVDELKTIYGCDSIVTLQLVVHETKDTYLIDTVKVHELFTRHGFNLTHENVGDYTHELMKQTIYGCDSLLHLSLHVFTYDTLFVDPCPDHYVDWRGGSYIGDGYYTDESTLKDDTIRMLRIDTRPKFGLEEQVSVEICEGETYRFKPNCCEHLHYTWSPSTYLSSVSESTPSMAGVADITYRVNVTDEVCEDSFTVDVVVLENPRIDTVYYEEAFQWLTMEVSGGTPGYQYFWRTEPWQLENTYSTKFSPAPMLVKVMDSKGCQADSVVSLAVQIIPAEIMTPDGDGVNDLWEVENLDYYNYYTVSIYDRFGKLLIEIDNEFDGWDGTYNGHPMPSTDYWYVIQLREIDREYTGHFTLIR